MAAFLATCHLLSPLADRALGTRRQAFTSFSGGLAAGYVFLHLLPELDRGHRLLGTRIYFVALVAFTLTYALECLTQGRSESSVIHRVRFTIHVAFLFAYTVLIAFTLVVQLPDAPLLIAVFAISIGMHFLACDIGCIEKFGERFVRRGRYALAGAAVLGYTGSLLRPPRDVVVDTVTAAVAGFILFSVFREELPNLRKARLRLFLAGVVTFFVMHVLLETGGE